MTPIAQFLASPFGNHRTAAQFTVTRVAKVEGEAPLCALKAAVVAFIALKWVGFGHLEVSFMNDDSFAARRGRFGPNQRGKRRFVIIVARRAVRFSKKSVAFKLVVT